MRAFQVDEATGVDRAVTQGNPHGHQTIGASVEVVEIDVGAGRAARSLVEVSDDAPREQGRGTAEERLGEVQERRVLDEPGEARGPCEAMGRVARPAVRRNVRWYLSGEDPAGRFGAGPEVGRVEPGEVIRSQRTDLVGVDHIAQVQVTVVMEPTPEGVRVGQQRRAVAQRLEEGPVDGDRQTVRS